MDRAVGVNRFGRIVLEFLAVNAVPARLASCHHIAGGLDPCKELLDQVKVSRIGGADEAVLADSPAGPEVAVRGTDAIAVFLG